MIGMINRLFPCIIGLVFSCQVTLAEEQSSAEQLIIASIECPVQGTGLMTGIATVYSLVDKYERHGNVISISSNVDMEFGGNGELKTMKGSAISKFILEDVKLAKEDIKPGDANIYSRLYLRCKNASDQCIAFTSNLTGTPPFFRQTSLELPFCSDEAMNNFVDAFDEFTKYP